MHKDIARSAGELKAAWDGMKMAASAPGTIPQLKAAFAAMENDYFDNYQAKRQAFYEALAAGETPALNRDEVEGLWPAASDSLRSLMATAVARSEEHRSELQSLMRKSYAVV